MSSVVYTAKVSMSNSRAEDRILVAISPLGTLARVGN